MDFSFYHDSSILQRMVNICMLIILLVVTIILLNDLIGRYNCYDIWIVKKTYDHVVYYNVIFRIKITNLRYFI